MSPLPSFEEIVAQQVAAVAAALRSQAQARGTELSPELADRVARQALVGSVRSGDGQRLRQVFGAEPPLALVAFDTPGVHDYVFRVGRPVDVAGGSHLVAALTDADLAGSAGEYLGRSIDSLDDLLTRAGHPLGAMIFAGGGRGCVVVPAHRAPELQRALEQVLSGVTAGDLTTVTAALPCWPEDLGSEAAPTASAGSPATRYGATISVLMAALGRERSRREAFGETVEPRARRCDACRRRKGTVSRRQVDEWICPGCAARRSLGGRLKKGANEGATFLDLVPEDDPRLALLYADGANVGAAFQQVDAPPRHRALSLAVEEAFDAAVHAIREAPELRDADDRLLCQCPIRGGDDAVLILPALQAFEATRTLIDTVESRFDLTGNPLLRDAFTDAPETLRSSVATFGVGVGIVFGAAHFPVGFMVRYAEELLRSAKSHLHAGDALAAKDDPTPRSAVDFLVLGSGNPLSTSIQNLRRNHLYRPPADGEPGLALTEGPWSRQAFEDLLAEARALRKVPRSQLFAIRQEIFRGPTLARSLWRYQHGRAKPGSEWARYRQDRGAGIEAVDELLFRPAENPPDEGEWLSTRFLDALEAVELLPTNDTATRGVER
ncbi:MAG: Cas10/Cmr2 second palm domain-containing protein [Thermoanaerobaculia bacterium]